MKQIMFKIIQVEWKYAYCLNWVSEGEDSIFYQKQSTKLVYLQEI